MGQFIGQKEVEYQTYILSYDFTQSSKVIIEEYSGISQLLLTYIHYEFTGTSEPLKDKVCGT